MLKILEISDVTDFLATCLFRINLFKISIVFSLIIFLVFNIKFHNICLT